MEGREIVLQFSIAISSVFTPYPQDSSPSGSFLRLEDFFHINKVSSPS